MTSLRAATHRLVRCAVPRRAGRISALVLLGALFAASLAPNAARARELTLAVRSAARLKAVQSVFVAPFQAASGIGVLAQSRPDGMPALTTGLASKDPAWDLVEVNGTELLAGCAANLFAHIDPALIGGAAHYLPFALSPCGVGATIETTLLAWDQDKFAGIPSWADFWDIAKYPGKRGLRQGVRGNLEIALMADGVAPNAVYKVLATKDGVDRAFRKLDQLRPYIVWWKTPDQAAKILASGGVLMTSAPSEAIVAAGRTAHRNFGMRWADGIVELLSWAIARTSPNQAAALQFLYFAGTPAIEGQLAARFGEGGLAVGANDDLTPAQAALSPSNPANMKDALRMDDAFWQAHLPALRQRFDAWLAH